MAQHPPTPKSRRVLRRSAAGLFGPTVAGFGQPAASERAALALRAAPPTHSAAPDAVVFLIPLVGPDHVGDWSAVVARLGYTLQSLLAQEDPRWRAVICCQTRPALPDDPRISYLEFHDPTPGNDKWRKLAALADHLTAMDVVRGYAMSFDADDLLHRGAVAEMLRRQTPGGYLAATGFVRDMSTGTIARAGPPTPHRPLRKPFWKLCGSCAALRYDLGRGPAQTTFLRAMWQHEHRMFAYLAALAGQPLTPLEQPRVLYLLNHGENFGARRGRIAFKSRFVERFRIDDAATLRSIAAGFPDPGR